MATSQISSNKLRFCFVNFIVSLLFSMVIGSLATAQETRPLPIIEKEIATDPNIEHQVQLQQELTKLLAENARINKEKIEYLEAQSQKVFWTQCLIGFLVLMMLVSLFSFWRLHVQHKFQDGIEALTTSIKNFQDSLFSLSFIDTSQLSTIGSVSSFHTTDIDAANTQQGSHSGFRKTLNPNTGSHATNGPNSDEFSDIRGFFDAWLNVYKPGDPRYEEALAAATKPNSPKPWLQALDSSRQNKDQSGFESISKELKKFFNIKLLPWQNSDNATKKQLSEYPHVVNKIIEFWPKDEIVIYLERLLNNSRMSPREGFDLIIFQQLESLLELAQREDRPRQIQQLREMGIADFLFSTPSAATKSAAILSSANLAPDSVSRPNRVTPPVTIQTSINTEQAAVSTVLSEPAVHTRLSALSTTAPTNLAASSITTSAATKETVLTNNGASIGVNTSANTVADPVNVAGAHEVRLQLAQAYLDMADTEGACLLLEEVIRDAAPAQQAHAKRLLADIEKKRANLDGGNKKSYFH